MGCKMSRPGNMVVPAPSDDCKAHPGGTDETSAAQRLRPRKQARKEDSPARDELQPSRTQLMDVNPSPGVRTPTVDRTQSTDNSVRKRISDLLISWKNDGLLGDIENHATTVVGQSVHELAAALTSQHVQYLQRLRGRPLFQIQLAKAFAIFTWISKHIRYDFRAKNSLKSGTFSAKQTSLEYILRKRSTICMGYSKMFDALSKKAGLETVTINGHMKSFSTEVFQSGSYQPFTPQVHNTHSWNAVSIVIISCIDLHYESVSKWL